MIARIWRGETKASDAEAYLKYVFESRIAACSSTPGKHGAWVLRHIEGDVAHFMTLAFWEARSAIITFAGKDPEVAKYYPEDRQYLLRVEPNVAHLRRVPVI